MSQLVLLFHILQKLRQYNLAILIFRRLSPYHIGDIARELPFRPLPRNDVVEGAIDLPQFHGGVFVEALVLHQGQNSFQHRDKIYYI